MLCNVYNFTCYLIFNIMIANSQSKKYITRFYADLKFVHCPQTNDKVYLGKGSLWYPRYCGVWSRTQINLEKQIVQIVDFFLFRQFLIYTQQLSVNFIRTELKTLEWDILNHNRLISVSNVHTFDFLLMILFLDISVL